MGTTTIHTMPWLQSTNLTLPAPVTGTLSKAVLPTNTNIKDAIDCLVKHGVAAIESKEMILPPWKEMEEVFSKLDHETVDLVNSFYDEKKIIKTGFEEGQGINIDKKTAFDINPERLEALRSSGVLNRFPEFPKLMDFFSTSEQFTKDCLAALAVHTGDPSLLNLSSTNFRMIDYPAGQGSCNLHRDFGLLTLLQQDHVGGLEVEVEGHLQPVPANTTLLLAGWCLHIRSNGLIPAPLHRVIAPKHRRHSAVVFLAPPKDLLLEPLSTLGPPVFRSLHVKELKEIMAKRWRVREGTFAPEDEEDKSTSQDDIVNNLVKI